MPNLSFKISTKGKILGIIPELKTDLLFFFRIFRFYINSEDNYKYEVVTEGVYRKQRKFDGVEMEVDIKCERVEDTHDINHYLLWTSVTDWFGDPLFEKIIIFSRAPCKCEYYSKRSSWNHEIVQHFS